MNTPDLQAGPVVSARGRWMALIAAFLGWLFDGLGLHLDALSLLMMLVVLAQDMAGIVPRTVYGINAVLLILLIGGSRMLARWVLTKQSSQTPANRKKAGFIPPVIIYGAGDAGAGGRERTG